MYAEVIENKSDKDRDYYRFYLNDKLILVLDKYCKQSRQTTRHKFKIIAQWDRLDKRDSTIKEKPIIPDNIICDAIIQVKNLIKFEQ